MTHGVGAGGDGRATTGLCESRDPENHRWELALNTHPMPYSPGQHALLQSQQDKNVWKCCCPTQGRLTWVEAPKDQGSGPLMSCKHLRSKARHQTIRTLIVLLSLEAFAMSPVAPNCHHQLYGTDTDIKKKSSEAPPKLIQAGVNTSSD